MFNVISSEHYTLSTMPAPHWLSQSRGQRLGFAEFLIKMTIYVAYSHYADDPISPRLSKKTEEAASFPPQSLEHIPLVTKTLLCHAFHRRQHDAAPKSSLPWTPPLPTPLQGHSRQSWGREHGGWGWVKGGPQWGKGGGGCFGFKSSILVTESPHKSTIKSAQSARNCYKLQGFASVTQTKKNIPRLASVKS